jgi:membrane protein YqaA with SNARE-associated domain
LGLFIIALITNATVIISAPIALAFTCAAAPAFGAFSVGLVSGIGAALGETTGWLVGYSGNSVLPKGRWYKRLRIFMRRNGLLAIFLLSAVPNPIFDVGGMIAGALKMPLWQFLIASALGKTIRFTVTAFVCLGGLPWLEKLLNG